MKNLHDVISVNVYRYACGMSNLRLMSSLHLIVMCIIVLSRLFLPYTSQTQFKFTTPDLASHSWLS